MTSIFGPLDKRQRAAHDAAAAADTEFGFEDRADLLNDLLEEDLTTFPLLSCPPEVLSAILLLMEVETCVRMRPVCGPMRSAIDGNFGFWHLVTIRDYADLGGLTKHYKGLRTLADAWDDSKAIRRLEWDPLMICAPPRLRYALLATGEARRRLWNQHGHALGAGWAWFSSKVCRRMAASTFLRWAPLQHDEAAVREVMGALGQSKPPEQEAASSVQETPGAQKFRCGRSDAVTLSAEAVSDIYETVQRWHNKAHRDMMRAHFRDPEQPGGADAAASAAAAAASGSFSVTPTLDAAEAAAFAAGEVAAAVAAEEGAEGAEDARGAASHRIEEAQLRLALELSKQEAEGGDAAARAEEPAAKAEEKAKPPPAAAAAPRQEPAGLPLRLEGQAPSLIVFLKDHCLAQRVEALPESLEKSVEHIVNKMTTPSTWGLLYESITEELGFRAKCAAHILCGAHLQCFDELLSGDISLQQERMCLPIWRSSAAVMTNLSKLRRVSCKPELRQARCDMLRQASLEWCELEDLTEFMDSHLSPLEQAIDNFRGAAEATGQAHTPHLRDAGRLMFRNFCLLDSRVFRPLCLAAYALVHEVHTAEDPEERRKLTELLDSLHTMLTSCDVADDHLSSSKNTKDAFVEHLVVPITAAVEHLSDWDIRGHPSRECRGRRDRR